MTLQEINKMNVTEPYCFETDREEEWYKFGLTEGADVAIKEFTEKAVEWLATNLRCDGYRLQEKAKLLRDLRKAMLE